MVLTNAITDIVYKVSDEFINKINVSNWYDLEIKLKEQEKIYQSPAGSPANVGFSASVLGLKVAIQGTLGNDDLAEEYSKKIVNYELFDDIKRTNGKSGVCYTFITPDGERHFKAVLNDAPKFDLSNNVFVPKVFHTSVYEVESNPVKVLEHIANLKSKGVKVSLDLADHRICKKLKHHVLQILELTDILFTSSQEYHVLYNGVPSGNISQEVLCMKMGAHGSCILHRDGNRIVIRPVKAKLVNTNGAGDNYAAGFLYSYLKGFNLETCGVIASDVAARVCAQVSSCLDK